MQIERAIFGEKRFTEHELRQIRLQMYDRDQDFREYALRFARCLKSFVALPNPNLRTVANCAAGLAAAELQIDEQQKVCEIASGQHLGKGGFARIVPDDHRIFVRFDGACACLVAIVALHEVKHRAQVIGGQFMRLYAENKSEGQAEDFAASIMRKYHLVCGGCGKSY